MAIERFSLSEITDFVRLNIGEEDPAQSQIADANPASGNTLVGIYRVINNYLQSLPIRVGTMMRSLGMRPKDGMVQLSMWRTAATALTTASGDSVVYFPLDYYHYISFYDTQYRRPIYPVHSPLRWKAQVERFQLKPAGPPEAIVIQGFVTISSNWRRRGLLLPSTPTGNTPAINIDYYRLPALMAGTSPTAEYPDIDLAFQDICIVGPTCELMRTDDPSYPRFKERETEILIALAYTAEAI